MWPSLELETSMLDPFQQRGRRHFESSLQLYSSLLEGHPWSIALLSRGSALILEVMGGTGLGATALAKALEARGVRAEVVIADRRGDLLRLAERWGARLGLRVQVIEADPITTTMPGENYDVVLMHGHPPSLVDPWSFAMLLARISGRMGEKGLMIMRAIDHRYLWIKGEVREIAAARDIDGNLIIGILESYDHVRGTIRKAVMRPGEAKVEELEVSPWSLADLASMLWLFFRDVDTYPRRTPADRPFILMAYRPRRILAPQELEEPSLLRQE